MEMNFLKKIRKLNSVLQNSNKEIHSFDDLCKILSNLMGSNVYILNKSGNVIGVHHDIKSETAIITDPDTGVERFPREYNEALLAINETKYNLTDEESLAIFKYDYDTYDKLHTVIPIFCAGQRLGTLIATRYSPEYNEEDLIMGEYGATVVGLEMQRRRLTEVKEEERKREVVQMAIGTLSYSENEAAKQIFSELEGSEGLLVASKIADRSGITRSVIVNALRKLECAAVIETRSLGMKGTHIKILNDKFVDELEKPGE